MRQVEETTDWWRKGTDKYPLSFTDLCMCKESIAVFLHALPAPIFSVSYGYEGLKVSSLQAILQQLLGCINILRDALHTLVQHP